MTLKVTRGVIGCLAYCAECEWSCENYLVAREDARKHAEYFGHTVNVEQTTTITYAVDLRAQAKAIREGR